MDAIVEVCLTAVFVLGTFFGPVIVYELYHTMEDN